MYAQIMRNYHRLEVQREKKIGFRGTLILPAQEQDEGGEKGRGENDGGMTKIACCACNTIEFGCESFLISRSCRTEQDDK